MTLPMSSGLQSAQEQLDELDALLQRMLALPIDANTTETEEAAEPTLLPFPPSAPSASAPASASTAAPASASITASATALPASAVASEPTRSTSLPPLPPYRSTPLTTLPEPDDFRLPDPPSPLFPPLPPLPPLPPPASVRHPEWFARGRSVEPSTATEPTAPPLPTAVPQPTAAAVPEVSAKAAASASVRGGSSAEAKPATTSAAASVPLRAASPAAAGRQPGSPAFGGVGPQQPIQDSKPFGAGVGTRTEPTEPSERTEGIEPASPTAIPQGRPTAPPARQAPQAVPLSQPPAVPLGPSPASPAAPGAGDNDAWKIPLFGQEAVPSLGPTIAPRADWFRDLPVAATGAAAPIKQWHESIPLPPTPPVAVPATPTPFPAAVSPSQTPPAAVSAAPTTPLVYGATPAVPITPTLPNLNLPPVATAAAASAPSTPMAKKQADSPAESETVSPTSAAASPRRKATPSRSAEAVVAERLPLWLWPLAGVNFVLEVPLLLLGPLGSWCRAPVGRNLLGGAGIVMLLAAVVLAVKDLLP